MILLNFGLIPEDERILSGSKPDRLGMKYHNLEFTRIAWGQFIHRLRVSLEGRIARRLAEYKARAVRQPDRTGEMVRAIL
jgi:hypothetical protein